MAVWRGWLASSIVLGLGIGALFAANPQWDLQISAWFFDPQAARFPLATDDTWNVVRRAANFVPFLLMLPAFGALIGKLLFPQARMAVAPSVVLFLLGSCMIGPGLTSNVLLKENSGRPRPNHVQQFAGTATFQPWWRPDGTCTRNCSFVSGETSMAFWTFAPASLASPQLRPAAVGAALVFGASVGTLRVLFGRHFVTDVIFAGVLTVVIIIVLHRLLLDPVRRNDEMLERAIERASVALHRGVGLILAWIGAAFAGAGSMFREAGVHLQKRVACL